MRDAVLDVANDTDAPLAVMTSVASAIDRPTAQRLRDNGIPVLEGARSGLAALGHLVRWPLPVDEAQARGPRREIRADSSSLEMLAGYGIPTVESRAAGSLDEALSAAAALGYPVALKTRWRAAQDRGRWGGRWGSPTRLR